MITIVDGITPVQTQNKINLNMTDIKSDTMATLQTTFTETDQRCQMDISNEVQQSMFGQTNLFIKTNQNKVVTKTEIRRTVRPAKEMKQMTGKLYHTKDRHENITTITDAKQILNAGTVGSRTTRQVYVDMVRNLYAEIVTDVGIKQNYVLMTLMTLKVLGIRPGRQCRNEWHFHVLFICSLMQRG